MDNDLFKERNLEGEKLEEQGKIDEAIILYEENIADGDENDHPYERLARLYHKKKKYDEERRVLLKAIKVFSHLKKTYQRPNIITKLNYFVERLKKWLEDRKDKDDIKDFMKKNADSTVQQYRNIFIASQSFLLVVGATLLDISPILVGIAALLAILSIWWIWHRIITVQKQKADFYVYRIGDVFNIKFPQYIKHVKYKKKRREIYDVMTLILDRPKVSRKGEIIKRNNETEKEEFKTNRYTRIKLDIVIPSIMTLVWGLFILYEFNIFGLKILYFNALPNV